MAGGDNSVRIILPKGRIFYRELGKLKLVRTL